MLDLLHREHCATVKLLAARLAITPTGVRQHLAVLERERLVAARLERGRAGRPAKLYALTEEGEALFPKNYALLANLLMEEIRAVAGAEVLQRILGRVSDRMAQPAREQTPADGQPLAERVAVVAALMEEQGSSTAIEERPDAVYLHEFTCPYPAVAARNSAVCAMEVDLVRRLSGADARLVSSLLRGDSACVYRIRPLERQAQPAGSSTIQQKARSS